MLYSDAEPRPTNAFEAALRPLQQDVEVWPENWPAFALFLVLRTQWRYSPRGPSGLDYAVLYPLLDRECSDAEAWASLFEDVRTLERAALDTMYPGDG